MNMPPDRKLDLITSTRQLAANSLLVVLKKAMGASQPISEARFRDLWLGELRKNSQIFPDGWYMPPPFGIGVLFGTGGKEGRQNYQSLRPPEMWPQEDIFLGRENVINYFYASPVNKSTGTIGDFGLTVYLGKDEKVKKHLKLCLQINKEIFDYIKVGKTFADVYQFAETVFEKYGVTNEVTSTTDQTGKDIGHTVPIVDSGSLDKPWVELSQQISTKRQFINSIEKTTYQPGMAITLEPRLTIKNKENIPMASFHTIVLINKDSSKKLLTGFDEIFKVAGMEYMLG